MTRETQGAIGYIGGSLEHRSPHSRVPPLDSPLVLAPSRREGDDAALQAWLAVRPVHVEIGFGRPHFLCDLACRHPEVRVLGFETQRRWCAAAARRATREGLQNLRVIEGDAREYVPRFLWPQSIDAYYLLFPDPWWKKKHHKRRVFRPDFVAALHTTLVPGGLLLVRTDVGAYGDLIESELRGHGGFDPGGLEPHPEDASPLADLPRSHREKKCAELGIPILEYRFTTLRSVPR